MPMPQPARNLRFREPLLDECRDDPRGLRAGDMRAQDRTPDALRLPIACAISRVGGATGEAAAAVRIADLIAATAAMWMCQRASTLRPNGRIPYFLRFYWRRGVVENGLFQDRANPLLQFHPGTASG
jgi:hypothetical protein